MLLLYEKKKLFTTTNLASRAIISKDRNTTTQIPVLNFIFPLEEILVLLFATANTSFAVVLAQMVVQLNTNYYNGYSQWMI